MGFYDMNDEKIVQALKDANCNADTIERFMQLKAEGLQEEAIRLLSCYRCHLVCAMHEAQKPVDILDYLIHQFQKNQR